MIEARYSSDFGSSQTSNPPAGWEEQTIESAHAEGLHIRVSGYSVNVKTRVARYPPLHDQYFTSGVHGPETCNMKTYAS
jgi:hypothetical protein